MLPPFTRAWVLLLLIPLWVIVLISKRYRLNREIAFPVARMSAAKRTLAHHPFLTALHSVPIFLRGIALSLFLVALAHPVGSDESVISGEGIDIMFALDMSGSMNAVDRPETEILEYLDAGKMPPNRFEVARDVLERFVRARSEDRIGLVVFGRQAFLKFPLTLDYAQIIRNLDELVLDNGRHKPGDNCDNDCTIDGNGTAIGDALARSYRRLRRSGGKSRVVVLITDGKNEGGTVDPDTMIKLLVNLPEGSKVQVYTILVGDPALTHVQAVNPITGSISYVKQDRLIPTDPELLARIAEETGGEFWKAKDEIAFRRAFDELEQTLFESGRTVRTEELFHKPLWAGLWVLLLEGLLVGLFLRRFP
jgi:Ca-activated chloride channel family protein